jgi:hypothetical protein
MCDLTVFSLRWMRPAISIGEADRDEAEDLQLCMAQWAARHRGNQGADGDTPVRAQTPWCLHLDVQGGLQQRLGRDHCPR